nr:hypothetical protein K-LCC10_0505 [Kaumoebavirus]
MERKVVDPKLVEFLDSALCHDITDLILKEVVRKPIMKEFTMTYTDDMISWEKDGAVLNIHYCPNCWRSKEKRVVKSKKSMGSINRSHCSKALQTRPKFLKVMREFWV